MNTNPLIASLLLYLISLLPVIEPRYGIVIGLKLFKLDYTLSLTICILATLTLAVLLPLVVSTVERYLIKISFVSKFYRRYVDRIRETIERSRIFKISVLLGVYVFVLVPLPASGMWTGAIISRVLGFNYGETLLILLLGGLSSLLSTCLLTIVTSIFA